MRKSLLSGLSKIIVAIIFIACSLTAHSSDSTIFKDHFNRSELGSSWQEPTSWSISDGSAYNYIDGIGGKLRTSEKIDSSTYIIETKASGFTVNYMREFRITFGQNNLSNDSMYVLSYKPYEGGKFTLSVSSNNMYFPKSLDEAVIYPNLNPNDWYSFKIAHYKSGLIQVYLDKGEGYGTTPFLETIDHTYEKAGHIGWQIDTQTYPESFYVDWINVYRPSAEKADVREKANEDDLITQVSAKSGLEYKVAKLDSGIHQYTDRDYIITSAPSYLIGASLIQTAMNDKKTISESFLTFFLKKDAIIYIGYDPRAATIPAWLNGWTKTRAHITTNDPLCPYLDVYSKPAAEVYPYPTSLGGNLSDLESGAQVNYIVMAIMRPDTSPMEAENAFLSGADAESYNAGYRGSGYADFKHLSNDYIEWTVKIDVPGSYNTGFTYANGRPQDRPLKIEYDGVDYGLLPFSSTGSWLTWSFLTGHTVYLEPGIHKIRATTTGLSGPNIDQLTLNYISPATPNAYVKKDLQNHTIVSSLINQPLKVYPNPFSNSTTINYTVTKKSMVNLTIFTILGQQIQNLVNQEMEAGNYKTPFYAPISKGIYIYELKIGNVIKTGKLIKE